MNRAADVLAGRYGQRPSLSTLTSKNNTSIEGSVGNNITSIEIPAEVDALIDNKAYYNKFRALMREYPKEIMALVELAPTKDQPSHWFARVTAKKNWERTLKFLAELFRVRELAERVANKLKTAATGFIYQQVWRGVNVERWADTAAEAGGTPGQILHMAMQTGARHRMSRWGEARSAESSCEVSSGRRRLYGQPSLDARARRSLG